jgi:hypothetical protein
MHARRDFEKDFENNNVRRARQKADELFVRDAALTPSNHNTDGDCVMSHIVPCPRI